jgi:hypothetical protein
VALGVVGQGEGLRTHRGFCREGLRHGLGETQGARCAVYAAAPGCMTVTEGCFSDDCDCHSYNL